MTSLTKHVTAISVLLAFTALVMLVAGLTPWCFFVALIGAVLSVVDNRQWRKKLAP